MSVRPKLCMQTVVQACQHNYISMLFYVSFLVIKIFVVISLLTHYAIGIINNGIRTCSVSVSPARQTVSKAASKTHV